MIEQLEQSADMASASPQRPDSEMLRGFWYVALRGAQLQRGHTPTREAGSHRRRKASPPEPPTHLPTGITEMDQLLGGGDCLRIGDGPELRLIEVTS